MTPKALNTAIRWQETTWQASRRDGHSSSGIFALHSLDISSANSHEGASAMNVARRHAGAAQWALAREQACIRGNQALECVGNACG
jgi:hypothetical protein